MSEYSVLLNCLSYLAAKKNREVSEVNCEHSGTENFHMRLELKKALVTVMFNANFFFAIFVFSVW